MKVSFCAVTDVGCKRPHNEDSFMLGNLQSREVLRSNDAGQWDVGEKGAVFSVLDGMGGAAAGEVASDLAAKTLFEQMSEVGEGRAPQEYAQHLDRSIQEANRRIHALQKEDVSKKGMGTTLSAGSVYREHLFLAQVGDSRAYVIRDWKVKQVTKDQSLVEHLLSQGQLTLEQAANFRGKNVILQALGPIPEVLVDLKHISLCRGDHLVLCTDGLHGVVEENEILALVARNDTLKDGAEALVKLANERGGPDNITVAIARFHGDELPEPCDEPEPRPVEYVRAQQQKETEELESDLGVGYHLTKGFKSPLVLALLGLLALIVIGGFVANFYSAASKVEKNEPVVSLRTGVVVVVSEQKGAHVFIGGDDYGPLEGKGKSITLVEGAHELQLRRGKWRSVVKKIKVVPSKSLLVEFTGRKAVVTSTPVKPGS